TGKPAKNLAVTSGPTSSARSEQEALARGMLKRSLTSKATRKITAPSVRQPAERRPELPVPPASSWPRLRPLLRLTLRQRGSLRSDEFRDSKYSISPAPLCA